MSPPPPAANAHGENSPALFVNSSFAFASAAEAAAKFADDGGGYVYSRFSNPTVDWLNRRFAELEAAPCALSTASGMAAILLAGLATCASGKKIVCAADVFGATRQLLNRVFANFGVGVQYVELTNLDEWRQAADSNTALMLLETPSNPMQKIADLPALAQIAKDCGALLAVDNCFAAGLQKPLQWGANLVVHSATKYPDGQGRVLGGALAGDEELLVGRCLPLLRCGGMSLSPFNAWLLAKSMETLPLRLREHSRAALQTAAWLQEQKQVRQVWHTALPSHPQHALAMRQQNGMGGGLVSFAVAGGKRAAWRVLDCLQTVAITANFGDAKHLATHPASTTHCRLSPQERAQMGIDDDVIRLSVGLGDAKALQADLAQALAAAG